MTATPADEEPPGFLKRHVKPQRSKPQSQKDSNGSSLAPTLDDLSIDGTSAPEEPAPPHSQAQTLSGKVLFILVDFIDRSGTYSETDWANFLSNNIADYFNSASYGRVNLGPAQETSNTINNGVIGWLNLSQNHPYTSGNTVTDDEKKQLANDAIVAADPYIDYSTYDVNGDGYVDAKELAVVIVVAGYENAYSAAYTPHVWAHKWSLDRPFPTLDGVTIGAYHNGTGGYGMFGEIHQSSAGNGHQATMGVMTHELGHLIFGFPDLYDTDSSSSGIGSFCLMAGGSWGLKSGDAWSGETPVLPSAWIKQSAGWVETSTACGSKKITAAGDSSATSMNTVFRINTANSPDEYFLVENRQLSGYDRGFERWFPASSGGLAVFHIDDTQTSNTNDSQRWVDLEEADGSQMGTTRGVPEDLWFLGQAANAGGFTDLSNPNSKLYSGTSSNVSIADISARGTIMTATLGANSN